MTTMHNHIIEYDDGDFDFFFASDETQAKETAFEMAKEHFWFEHELITRSRYRIFQLTENLE